MRNARIAEVFAPKRYAPLTGSQTQQRLRQFALTIASDTGKANDLALMDR